MSDLPTIDGDVIVIPAQEEKRYDIPWVTEFKVFADDPTNVRLYAIVRPSCVLSTGAREILIRDKTERVVDISDLFGILQGTKVEPKLTLATIQMGGQLMGLTLQFLKAVLEDKAAPDVQPVVDPPTDPVVDPTVSP